MLPANRWHPPCHHRPSGLERTVLGSNENRLPHWMSFCSFLREFSRRRRESEDTPHFVQQRGERKRLDENAGRFGRHRSGLIGRRHDHRNVNVFRQSGPEPRRGWQGELSDDDVWPRRVKGCRGFLATPSLCHLKSELVEIPHAHSSDSVVAVRDQHRWIPAREIDGATAAPGHAASILTPPFGCRH